MNTLVLGSIFCFPIMVRSELSLALQLEDTPQGMGVIFSRRATRKVRGILETHIWISGG